MNERVVIWLNGHPLYLSGVKRDEYGVVSEGWVENGAWQVKLRSGVSEAYNGEYKVSECPFETYEEIVVPFEWSGGYNETIWMAEQLKASKQS